MNKRHQRLSLVIADNHPVFLQGLVEVFRSHSDIKIVAQCQDGLATMTAIRKHAPDIAMIDFSMPGMNGLDVLAAVTTEELPTRVVLLTSALSGAQVMFAIETGAKGILFKSSSPNEIVRGIRKVAAGKYQFPKDLAEAVRKRRIKRPKNHQWLGHQLTPRENEVTRLLIKGLSNKVIGQQMNLLEGTVKTHLHNIFKKLRISNRTALATLIVSHQQRSRRSQP